MPGAAIANKRILLEDLNIRLAAGTNDFQGRAAARTAAAEVALNLDHYWGRSVGIVGPIDVIDLFSGCGGMSAGFRAFNAFMPAFRLSAAVDIDEVANRTYADNLGIIPFPVSVAELRRRPSLLHDVIGSVSRPGHPLVLIGCAPCQGFSSHRNAEGTGDNRNNLFLDFAAIAARLRPDAIIVENVPELLTQQHWGYVARVRKTLEAAGYSCHVSVHDMADFGVPQHRFRTLFLAIRRRFLPVEPPLRGRSYRTVRDAISHLPPIRAGERNVLDPMHYTASHRESTLRTIQAVPRNGGNRPPEAGPDCLRRIHARQGKPGYEDVYGRLHWDRPSITITAYARNPASGRFVHPEQDRGLSIREAALLQGFPDTYRFNGTLDDCFRQIGNAVPPIFSAYLAGSVLGELVAPRSARRRERGVVAPVGSSFARMIPAIKASRRLAGPASYA